MTVNNFKIVYCNSGMWHVRDKVRVQNLILFSFEGS